MPPSACLPRAPPAARPACRAPRLPRAPPAARPARLPARLPRAPRVFPRACCTPARLPRACCTPARLQRPTARPRAQRLACACLRSPAPTYAPRAPAAACPARLLPPAPRALLAQPLAHERSCCAQRRVVACAATQSNSPLFQLSQYKFFFFCTAIQIFFPATFLPQYTRLYCDTVSASLASQPAIQTSVLQYKIFQPSLLYCNTM